MRAQARSDTGDEQVAKERVRLWLRLLKTSRMIEAEIRERLRAKHGTTLPRFDVMAALCRTETGLKMSELSDELRVSNGNVTGIIERLVQDGLVVRIPVKGDRRATLVRLTTKGRAAFGQLAQEHERWIDEMLDGVDHNDAQALTSRLGAMTSRIEGRHTG